MLGSQINRDQKNHDSQRRDWIVRLFLRLAIREFSHILGRFPFFLAQKKTWRKEKNFHWRKKKNPVEMAPRQCRFLSLVVVERVLNKRLSFQLKLSQRFFANWGDPPPRTRRYALTCCSDSAKKLDGNQQLLMLNHLGCCRIWSCFPWCRSDLVDPTKWPEIGELRFRSIWLGFPRKKSPAKHRVHTCSLTSFSPSAGNCLNPNFWDWPRSDEF